MLKFQPLRIPAGWKVILNKFMEMETEDRPENSWVNFTEDITYLERKSERYTIGIDLGWYPDLDPEGAFHVNVILDGDWEKPFMKYVTRERKEVVTIIEDLLERYCSDDQIELDVQRYSEKK